MDWGMKNRIGRILQPETGRTVAQDETRGSRPRNASMISRVRASSGRRLVGAAPGQGASDREGIGIPNQAQASARSAGTPAA